MRIFDIIAKKRDGKELTDAEIAFFVKDYTAGRLKDAQASALIMAIYINGMNRRETVTLTLEMAHSGDMLDLSDMGGVTADKHSTGGVGDKTTLIVSPIVASLGVKVAKMSGRGLGHTGGTIDKLESIPGFRTSLTPDEFREQVKSVGMCVVGQTGRLAPADKKIYALRDETATLASIPLIASSIMSKKLAAGSDCIVLDVKTGSGAFMKTPEDALALARAMVEIGCDAGRKTAVLVTNMDIPLGTNIGNSLEVIEAVDVLKNRVKNDLFEVSLALSAKLVSLALNVTGEKARAMCIDVLESGQAFSMLRSFVSAQGGDTAVIDDTEMFKKASLTKELKAEKDGYISFMDAEKIGTASLLLGAGREDADKPVDHSAGIVLKKKTGEYVKLGDTIAVLYTNDSSAVSAAAEKFLSALEFSDCEVEKKPLIFETVG